MSSNIDPLTGEPPRDSAGRQRAAQASQPDFGTGQKYYDPGKTNTYVTNPDGSRTEISNSGVSHGELVPGIDGGTWEWDAASGTYHPYTSLEGAAGMYPGPDLQHYEGPTNVPLTPELRNTIDLTNQLITGETGIYRSLLEGKPRYEDVQTEYNLAQREMKQNTLPGIEQAFSAGPYGGAYYSGARAGAEADAISGLNEQYLTALSAERQRAESLSLQALGLLPSMASVQQIDLNNQVMNLNREIEVHYKNQELDYQSFMADLAGINMGLQQAGMEWQMDYYNTQMMLQQEAQKKAGQAATGQMIGGVIGLGASLAAAPFTSGTSLLFAPAAAQMGAGIGGYAATGSAQYGNTGMMLGGASSAAQGYALSQMMTPPTTQPTGSAGMVGSGQQNYVLGPGNTQLSPLSNGYESQYYQGSMFSPGLNPAPGQSQFLPTPSLTPYPQYPGF